MISIIVRLRRIDQKVRSKQYIQIIRRSIGGLLIPLVNLWVTERNLLFHFLPLPFLCLLLSPQQFLIFSLLVKPLLQFFDNISIFLFSRSESSKEESFNNNTGNMSDAAQIAGKRKRPSMYLSFVHLLVSFVPRPSLSFLFFVPFHPPSCIYLLNFFLFKTVSVILLFVLAASVYPISLEGCQGNFFSKADIILNFLPECLNRMLVSHLERNPPCHYSKSRLSLFLPLPWN
jgi:hypothetical protein